ncbi:MAG: tetratricopeptide repeat protein [Candidatus Obscuribacterales bacterium]|jgi:tetratricopeptide (TPR) repeat protein|nr:tetratricopeptide repeat protein [Candidatus Obscuribacterales bacterium]
MQTDTFWSTYVDLGANAQRLGHTVIADKMLEAALEESRRLGHLNLPPPTVFNKLAAAFYAQQEFRKAETVYKTALSTYEKRLTDDHPHLSNIMLNLAELYFSQEKYNQAEPLFEKSLSIDERRYGSNNPHIYRRMLKLAWIYCNQERHADAYNLLKRAQEFKDKPEADLQQEILARM